MRETKTRAPEETELLHTLHGCRASDRTGTEPHTEGPLTLVPVTWYVVPGFKTHKHTLTEGMLKVKEKPSRKTLIRHFIGLFLLKT